MIHVPEELARSQAKYNGEAGRAFVAGLPVLAEEFLGRWGLRVTGPSMHGVASLVLPVERVADGGRAALKMQLLDDESEGEPVGLRVWDGAGAVRLVEHDAGTGTMLLEWLDAARPLSSVADTREALRIVAGLLARLVAVPAPPGLRTLGDIAAAMLADVPEAAARLSAPDAAVLRDCAAAVREVVGEPGDRLLHWDLHLDNVLAAEREPWLAIDPKPLAGDPGFDLLPALTDRFDPDPDELLWRFDLLAEVVGDRRRAVAWTLGRVLQNGLWDVEDGEPALDAEQVALARILLARRA
ncbi:aminoglycoside phosphotransferase family protein [Streptomyces sp. WAC01280]|uniref:aminoglycoside phosphotransferase family protein n=1 Tax=Streptomyces sp. WAC01280 TaxID=2487424 RepID=UPI000F7B1647|nr:aminoglycoside phosphotransferase family protein [Streptomyces sp. WAC01280]RSS50413.1 hydroxyurea phosphotransferase [Streptomyces sp. WAC01280]